MKNKDKEKFLATLPKEIFDELPSNYDAMMDAVHEVPFRLAIGKPKKIITRHADPKENIGEAGILFFEKGEGIKAHQHTKDYEIYTFEDGSQQICNIDGWHAIPQTVKKTTVRFDKPIYNTIANPMVQK